MDLDGARNAKAEIFRHAFGFEEQPGPALAGRLPRFGLGGEIRVERLLRSMGPVQLATAPEATPPVAIGIRPPERPGDGAHRLLLMGPRRALRDHPAIERANAIARGECDYIACGRNRLFSFWQPPRHRPISPGSSVAHFRVTAGTLGAFVEFEGGQGLLSNNHVLANVNKGAQGDDILQPGKRDGGVSPADVVGALERFVPIDTAAGAINFVDCAVARLAAGVASSAAFMGADTNPTPPALTGVEAADLDGQEEVFKVGRTTGFTRGKVIAIEVDNYIVNVGSNLNPVIVRFDNQFQVASETIPFARPGDSGAIVMDASGRARGLLFAGSSSGGPDGLGLTAVNPIAAVLAELDVRLWIG